MTVKSFLLSLLVALAPMAALGEDAATQEAAPQPKERVAAQPEAALPLGTYRGPEGQTIELKEPLSRGGKVSKLTVKAIEIVNGRLTDGVYVGPAGASFRIEGEDIIIDNLPAPSPRVSEKGIIDDNRPAPSR